MPEITPQPSPIVQPQDIAADLPKATTTTTKTEESKTIPIDVQETICILHINGIKPLRVEMGEGRMTYHYADTPELSAITLKLGLEGPEAFTTTMDKVFGFWSSWKSNLARYNPRQVRSY